MAGRPEGSVETPESILKQELKKNRKLMDDIRERLAKMLANGEVRDAEVLAKIIDTLSKANATTLKIIDTAGRKDEGAEVESLSEEEFLKQIQKGQL